MNIRRTFNKMFVSKKKLNAALEKTISHDTCSAGRLRRIRTLLESGADPFCSDKLLVNAVFETDVLRLLLEYSPTGTVNNRLAFSGTTLAILCADFGLVQSLQVVIDAGADMNIQRESDGYTPLHAAAAKNSPAATQCILSTRPDLELRDRHGHTPLMTACGQNDTRTLAVVDKLLGAGANVHAVDLNGACPPLYWVAIGSSEVAHHVSCKLIAAGADMDFRDPSGNTFLHTVATASSLIYCRNLIDKGFDPLALNHAGLAPADVAARAGLKDVADYINLRIDQLYGPAERARKPEVREISISTPIDTTYIPRIRVRGTPPRKP
jgi:ankyrin repeat protein